MKPFWLVAGFSLSEAPRPPKGGTTNHARFMGSPDAIFSAYWDHEPVCGSPSPWGEGWGEGERRVQTTSRVQLDEVQLDERFMGRGIHKRPRRQLNVTSSRLAPRERGRRNRRYGSRIQM